VLVFVLLQVLNDRLMRFPQADADGLCTVLGDPFTKDEVDRPLSTSIDRSVFEQAGWIINRDDITVRGFVVSAL
jgi:hypothetical protein